MESAVLLNAVTSIKCAIGASVVKIACKPWKNQKQRSTEDLHAPIWEKHKLVQEEAVHQLSLDAWTSRTKLLILWQPKILNQHCVLWPKLFFLWVSMATVIPMKSLLLHLQQLLQILALTKPM